MHGGLSHGRRPGGSGGRGRGGLAWGVRREEPNGDAHGLAAFFFLEWIGGTAMILFFFPSFILGNSSMEQGALGWVQFGVGRA
jgi:hypothetical protein